MLSVEARATSGSVIVVFDPDRICSRTLLTLIVQQVFRPMTSAEPPKAVETLPGFKQACSVCDCEPKASFGTKLRRVIWLSGCMAYAALRMWVFKLPLVQTPFSLLGGGGPAWRPAACPRGP